jgi:hypothetical protein
MECEMTSRVHVAWLAEGYFRWLSDDIPEVLKEVLTP